MSNAALNAVWDRSRAKGGPRLVMLALADSANKETGRSWLGRPMLAEMSLLSERHIGRILADLVNMGEIEAVEVRPGRSTVYRLTPGSVPVVSPDDACDSQKSAATPDKTPGAGGRNTPDKMSGVGAGDTPDKMSPHP